MTLVPPVTAFAPRLCKRLVVGAALITGATLAGPAAGKAAEPVSLSFDLFAGGARVYAIDLDINLAPGAYTALIDTKTVGLASWFIDESFTMRASGSLKSDTARPARFYERKTEDGESKTVEVAWSGGKVSTKRSYTLDADRASAIDKVVTTAMPDPIGAILTHAMANVAKPCQGRERIYNGKEVFDFVFTFVKKDEFGPKDAGVYRGTSYQCVVEYKPVAGQSDRKLRRIAKNPPVYRVWFAPVVSKALDRTLLLPIAATGKLKGHDVVIYTQAATIAGRPLNQKSLASR